MLPDDWARGEAGEIIGAALEMVRELQDDASIEAAGERRALAKIIKRCREIQRRTTGG